MRNIVALLFKVCLVSFLLGGTALVFGQLAGLISQDGDLVIKSRETLAGPTYIISAAAGMLGFILGYLPEKAPGESGSRME